MAWRLRHRQTKGSATDRPHLIHRATSRLYFAVRRPTLAQGRKRRVFPRPENEMPVIRHETISQDTRGIAILSLAEHALKGLEVGRLLEQGKAGHGAIQHVVDEAARGDPSNTRHVRKTSGRPSLCQMSCVPFSSLAYVLWKTLAGWMRGAGLGDAPRPVIEELAKLKSGDVVLRARPARAQSIWPRLSHFNCPHAPLSLAAHPAQNPAPEPRP